MLKVINKEGKTTINNFFFDSLVILRTSLNARTKQRKLARVTAKDIPTNLPISVN